MSSNDTPLPRAIKIGTATVGLLGLDMALSRLLNQPDLPEDDAVAFLFNEVESQNYVPAAAAEKYREALRLVYRSLRGEAVAHKGLRIRILGPGCVSCNRLGQMLFEILQEMGLPADIEQVHDLDEIWRYGVLSTPALVINDQVMCAGRMPTRAEVEEWLRRELP